MEGTYRHTPDADSPEFDFLISNDDDERLSTIANNGSPPKLQSRPLPGTLDMPHTFPGYIPSHDSALLNFILGGSTAEIDTQVTPDLSSSTTQAYQINLDPFERIAYGLWLEAQLRLHGALDKPESDFHTTGGGDVHISTRRETDGLAAELGTLLRAIAGRKARDGAERGGHDGTAIGDGHDDDDDNDGDGRVEDIDASDDRNDDDDSKKA
ncbi:hypothetical protein B0A48_16741 [Cryoendolithus antarcticus]|uniref:Uncharacterized protein n=1 Tax=Cryoendolithus antarcticus TaxID=1507870 RepID=A0A1V8SE23_9PEZI|nr:hypothetical protein B0A48_16741 [Cryoendolithus antarcticus]